VSRLETASKGLYGKVIFLFVDIIIVSQKGTLFACISNTYY
jgi:hypothetical protein